MAKTLAIFLPHVGAVSETFITRQVRQLAPNQTVLITGKVIDGRISEGLPTLVIPYSEGPAVYKPEVQTRVLKFIEQHQVTHILCQYGCYGTEIVELNQRILKKPLFVHFHGGDASAMLRRPEMVQYYGRLSEQTSGIIAVSSSMAQRLRAVGIAEARIRVIHYGVEIPKEQASVSRNPCRFISITRLVPKKAPLKTLAAFQKASEIAPEITLDIVGDGELLHSVEEFISKHQLTAKVRLHGAVPFEYANQLLQCSSVYVQHSIVDPATGDAEGLPNAILEASAAGLPIISTIHEGIPEAVEHGTSGLLVSEGDIEGMADAMVRLARSPELRIAFGKAGRQRMFEKFNLHEQVSKLREWIEIDSKPPGGTRDQSIPVAKGSPQQFMKGEQDEKNSREIIRCSLSNPGTVREKLRFLQVDTFYSKPLQILYGKNTSLLESSSEVQREAIIRDGFAAVHVLAPSFKKFGYITEFIVGNDPVSQSKWAQENGVQLRNSSDWVHEIVQAQIEAFKPDVLYTTNAMVYDSNFIRKLSFKPKLIMGWQGSDIPPTTDWTEYDIILSALSGLREAAINYGAKTAEWFMPGFPVWVYDEIRNIQPITDLVFCGQWTKSQHPRRNHLLSYIAEHSSASRGKFNCEYYLSGEVECLPESVAIRNHGDRYGLNMLSAIRRGRIGFDARGEIRQMLSNTIKDIAGGETANMRLFETTGAGVFLLTEHMDNLSRFFEIGKEIETYRDEKDLLEKVQYYLHHPAERCAIAERGRQRCHRDHSLESRVAYLDAVIRNYLLRRCSHANAKESALEFPYTHSGEKHGSRPMQITTDKTRVNPISRQFGFDRGVPIDRYYIEKFLARHSDRITGRVLEIADNAYTTKFGKAPIKSEVLSVTPGSSTTIVGDLTNGKGLQEESFDCIILTQTLQFIYDVRSAISNAFRALRPNGMLLITASGISQISRYDMDRWGEYWRFTDKSLRQLLSDAAAGASITVECHGNVAVAKAFLDGLSYNEIPQEILDYQDADYQLLLTASVEKPAKALRSLTKIRPNATRPQISPAILLYHRIADDPIDAHLLCVSPNFFDEQLSILSDRYRVVSLAQLLDEVNQNRFEPGTIALTFDDGYLDVLTNGVPLLEKYQIPATVFVTSGKVGAQLGFWWDLAQKFFLENPNIPNEVEFRLKGSIRTFSCRTSSPKERLTAHDAFCKLMKGYPVSEIEECLLGIFKNYNVPGELAGGFPVVDQQTLFKLSRSALIDIGAHTVTHTRLSILSPEEQLAELQQSKQTLEQITGDLVRFVSYPFGGCGDFDVNSKNAVLMSGYHAGIANIQGSLERPVDICAVPRHLVRNWSGSTFEEWLFSGPKSNLEEATLGERMVRLTQNKISTAK